MTSTDAISTEELRDVLAEVEGKKSTQRVMAAINYLEEEDATMEEVAERYGYTGPWLSQWLDRLERLADEPFEEVVYDEHRSGRPSDSLKKSTSSTREVKLGILSKHVMDFMNEVQVRLVGTVEFLEDPVRRVFFHPSNDVEHLRASVFS